MRKTHRRIHSAVGHSTSFLDPSREILPRIPRQTRKPIKDTAYHLAPLPQAFYQGLKDAENLSEVTGSLDRHRITESMRGNMVNWMVEILATFRSNPQTLFLACKIMDRYFNRTLKPVHSSQLHLVGVVCMFMASKFEDVMPLSLFDIRETIAFKKFSEDSILQTELNILKTLDFNLHMPTAIDFLMHYHDRLNTPYGIQACSEVFLVISLHIYSMQSIRASLISAACVYLSSNSDKITLDSLTKLSGYAANKIMEVSYRLEKDLQILKVRYPYVKNTFLYMKCRINPNSTPPLIFESSEMQNEVDKVFNI